jgi:tetratricopeptide (TPR) repeat protein/tRNA A-37 threonylcarbamoyl transferase component Bud32
LRRAGRLLFLIAMNMVGISDSARVPINVAACTKCGSTSRVGRGFCLNCLLQRGLETETDSTETLDEVLAEVDVRDTEWRLGNYQILEEIGRGGMGVIYRARQRHSRRIVAVKRVLGYHADSRETLARFRREAQAAASLDHPNILPIYEVSESEDGLPFFSMKFASGGSLQEIGPTLRNGPRQCVALVAKIARAVQHAHGKGILHRDLKPGNILLDAHGEPLVSDFGLAKWLDTTSDLTRTLTIFGTPGYIAPEQASGAAAQLKPAADVYSLGAILFDLLAGRPPFLGSHALSVIRQAAETTAPKLRSLSRVADRDLETICARCLEREPSLRYRSANDLAVDLERWLEGRPIIARPVSPPVRIWRWSRRNRVLASALIACGLAATFAVSRQVQAWRLNLTVATQGAWNHSVDVEPLVDLDTAELRKDLALDLAAALQTTFEQLGPAVIRAAADGEVARRPGRTVLSGTIRLVEGRTRIALRLLDAKNRKLLLYGSSEGDAPGVIQEVVRNITGQAFSILSATDLRSIGQSSPDPGLQDDETRRLIAAGNDLASRAGEVDLERAIGCLRRAIAQQPRSSAAHAALVRAMGYRIGITSNRETLPEVLAHAQTAVALNPESGEAHLAYAAALRLKGHLRETLREAQLTLECANPSRRGVILIGTVWQLTGRPDRALPWFHLARETEPTAVDTEALMAECWAQLGDARRAEQLLQQHVAVHPERPEGWMGICWLRLLNGQLDEARAIYQQQWKGYADFTYAAQMAAAVEFLGRNFAEAERMYTELWSRDPAGGGSFCTLSYVSTLGRLKVEHDPTAGTELLERARSAEVGLLENGDENPETVYRLAAIEATLGEKEKALQYLSRAVEAGWNDHYILALDPRFDSVRALPPFRTLSEKMNERVALMRERAALRDPSLVNN